MNALTVISMTVSDGLCVIIAEGGISGLTLANARKGQHRLRASQSP